MTKLNTKKFNQLAEDYMKSKGYIKGNLEYLILDNRLEEERFQPEGLFLNKDGDKFLMYFLDKSDWFPKRKGGFVEKWVTGFDTWKYLYILMYERILNIPSAVLFHNEEEHEFIFKTLLELGNPDSKWRVNREFRQDVEKLEKKRIPFASDAYRFEYRHIVDRLFRNCGKNKGMSVWDVKKFVEGKIQFNKRLI